ncbi:MAG: hypothetical protein MUF18_09140 [Fimbriiglobus sp.]|nr:hypothetical protein [Fimbriiglobus sp.]
MSEIKFTNPDPNATPPRTFPSVITGTYRLFSLLITPLAASQPSPMAEGDPPPVPTPVPPPGPTPVPPPVPLPAQYPAVNVWFRASDNSYQSGPHSAVVLADTSDDGTVSITKGTWALNDPGVPTGKTYTIVATVSHNSYPSDTKSVDQVQK